MKIERAIGVRLRKERLQQGMTLEEVGDAMATYLGKPWTAQAVWQAEQGKRDFRAAQLLAFSLVFELPLVQLLGSVPRESGSITIDDYDLTADDITHLFPPAGDPVVARELLDIEYSVEKLSHEIRTINGTFLGQIDQHLREVNHLSFEASANARRLMDLIAAGELSPRVRARYDASRERLAIDAKLEAASREFYESEDKK